MITETTTLSEFQVFNKGLYAIVDDRNHSSFNLLSYLLRHVTQVLKAVRKGRYDKVDYHLCMGLSWALAIANRMHIDVASEMWIRFPGRCPYCSTKPCSCKERAQERQKLGKPIKEELPGALIAWQQMLGAIYPGNTTPDSAMHLAEEVGELNEAIRNYLATHRDDNFDKITEELIDVVANLFGLASCLQLNLSAKSASYFVDGCPKCRATPCDCGYVSTDDPPV